ncbi:pentatricopeptide repeat protein [Panacagrimonas perspica]|uniref:Pentatricopeptide repeat protein n=1 Tax=Panacagrimonas perspica TaxID=381431 RepID=A0A4R7PAT6_9GAMM|nr:tetratricopeptide repeat protein [Panacagrimonas perspica]TDU31175.1 pentatricopeptide repeat protein [Panacagrimonas perspica]
MTRRSHASRSSAAIPERAIALTREAIQLHRTGKLQEARATYRRALERAPRYADAQHFFGMLEYQNGDLDAGIRHVQRALDITPDYADAHANLALMMLTRGDHAACQKHLDKALLLTPEAIPPRTTQGRLYIALERIPDARQVFEEALARDLSGVDAQHQSSLHIGLARTLVAQGEIDKALGHYRTAVDLSPRIDRVRATLARALCRQGRLEEAAVCYREILERDPDNAAAQHLLAACGGAESVPQRADDTYVRKMFDDFAITFDKNLASLGYRAPALIDALMRDCVPAGSAALEVLDAGCGTGLLAELIKPLCSRLVGVDLSPKMLELAAGRKLYDDLQEGELVAWLDAHPGAFDVVTSADTLCYFGAIDDALHAAYRALRPGGWVFFSVEHLRDGSMDHRLQYHGRYAHRDVYVERAVRAAGFQDVRITQDVLRSENREPVHGLVVAARRDLP